ncbi:TonB-dependent vitamin B12 receptor BtuB [Citrobacter sp. JGM124]|uniref:TonB-dependent vitamin B12 receptor BtuB n=1 Tax=Citrobacter sp. JGM124 TaxID=2799789 RepID=UPI001BAA8B23|nr:TonB-dependent vitamin B12 receptor BtuB [Citrobacter sp. JGM124]MBS0849698.1 TonB-dependent vitamin B12 receptor BtuB [Citrobacter sp. JGM124]
MIMKQLSLLSVLSATAFSVWAQDNHSADSMVITANRFQQPVNTVLAPISVVTREQIDQWQSKSLTDILRRLPGVDIASNGGLGQSSSVYIRGAEARHTLVLIDGIPLAKAGITGTADFSQIPVSLIQRLELIRGPRSAVYGADAIGGVINIITQDDTPGGQIQAGVGSNRLQEYNGSLRHKVGDNTLLTLAGAYEDTKGFNVQPDAKDPLGDGRSGFNSKTFWGGVNHTFNENITGFIRGYGYSNKTGYSAGKNERQLYNHTYDTGINYANDIYSTFLRGSYQHYKDYNYLTTQGLYNTGSSLDDMTQRNLQWGNSLALGQGTVSAGIDWQQQKLTTEDTIVSQDYSRNNTGYYLTGQQQIETVTLEGSVRGDDNNQYGWNGTWQAAAGWQFIPDYRVTASYGTGFQAPTLGQLFGQKRFNIDPNPGLKPEKSKQFELGFEGQTGPVNWQLSAYRNKINNLIDYNSTKVGDDWIGNYSNLQAATIKGVEWTGSFDTGIFSHQLTFGYLDPRRDSDNQVLARRSRHQYKYQLDWNMLGAEMNVAYQYYGKRLNNNTSQNQLPSYSLVDISVSYPVTSHLTIRGKIANLFDKDYETAYGYQTPGREYYLSGGYTF